jgi:hypothetical protein
LASPIGNNEAVGETVHDFIVLGNRCGGKDIGEQIASKYKVFLCVPKEFNGDTDKEVYNNALKDIIDNKDITILTLDENKKSMSTANLLLSSTNVSGHVKPTSKNTYNPMSPDNSVAPNTKFTPDHGTTSASTPSPMYGPESQPTPDSAQQRKLDSINEINLNKLKTALSTNIKNINVDLLDIQDKRQYDYHSLTEIFKNKCNEPGDDVVPPGKFANDHGVKPFPKSVQVEKYSVFNKMYDRGTTFGKVDPELLKLSYVYYSLDRNHSNIKGLLILLEENSEVGKKQKSDSTSLDSTSLVNVKMSKYLFSCNINYDNLKIQDVSSIAPNVGSLCSEMANGSIDAVDVALMKAAADRTLKIGALLSSVRLTADTIYFLTHDIKNYYYNKIVRVKINDGEFEEVKLYAVYTSVYSHPPESCSRRIVIYQDIQNVDPELKKLKNEEIFLTKKCEALRQEIENLNNAVTDLDKLLESTTSLITTTSENTRRINVNDITREYSAYFNKYIDISSKICPDDDFKGRLSDFISQIDRASKSFTLDLKKEAMDFLVLLSKKVSGCIDSVNKKITTINETLTTYNSGLGDVKNTISYKINNVSGKISFDETLGKGGKEIGGRRTKRSIKVITKRKIKVKSKTIKKKSRRRNKTRRQRKKL